MVASNTAGYSFTGGDHMGSTGSTNITSYTQMGGGYRRKGKQRKPKKSKIKKGKKTLKSSRGYRKKISKKVRKLTKMRRNTMKRLCKSYKSKKKNVNNPCAIKDRIISSLESGKKPSKEDLSKLSPSVQSFLNGISNDSKTSSGSSLRLSKMSSSPPSSMGSSLTPWPSLSGYTRKKSKGSKKGQKGKKGKVSTKSFESARKELDKLLKQGKVRSRSR